MAQAHIALDTPRRPFALMARWTAFREHARERREAKRILANMLAERELGRATGARV
jgi:hypothetical protein